MGFKKWQECMGSEITETVTGLMEMPAFISVVTTNVKLKRPFYTQAIKTKIIF